MGSGKLTRDGLTKAEKVKDDDQAVTRDWIREVSLDDSEDIN